MKDIICTTCGYVGKAKKMVKGSIVIELALWLMFIIPGLIYSLWRLTSKHDACPKCGGINLIPVDSPNGQKILAEKK